jgi:hypothetical protein
MPFPGSCLKIQQFSKRLVVVAAAATTTTLLVIGLQSIGEQV